MLVSAVAGNARWCTGSLLIFKAIPLSQWVVVQFQSVTVEFHSGIQFALERECVKCEFKSISERNRRDVIRLRNKARLK